jgi:phage N-6-adenine-methyltransferase
MKGRNVVFSSGKDDWQTPPDLFKALDDEFHFTLDAAASGPNLLPRWLGPNSPIAEDALAASWKDEVCFLNPPYSMVGQFIAKASHEQKHATTVVLVPARTDTKWWHLYVWNQWRHKWEVGVQGRFIRGRVKFIDPTGYTKGPAPFPSVIIIFGRI